MDAANRGKWIPPLPQGWEARWAPDQNAFFFINHNTRKTQWEDPRFSRPQSSNAAAAAQSLGHSGSQPSQNNSQKSRDTLPMRDLSPYRKSSANSSSYQKESTESSMTVEVNQAVVNKLLKEYPKAKKDLIVDILRLCHDNEREAREQLKEFGFEEAKPHASQQSVKLPSQQTQKQEPTDSEKKRILSQLQTMFPSIYPNVLEVALKTKNYDKDAAASLLRSWSSSQQERPQNQNTASRTSRGSTPTSSASTSRSTPVSLQPAALSDPVSLRPSSSADSGARRTPSPSHQRVSETQNQKKTSPSHGPHISAAQVTKRARRPKPASHQVVTSQPVQSNTRQNDKLAHHTMAKGPDASLRKGPDSTLLCSDYVQVSGPDRKLRAGADRLRVMGPQGAQGPDLSLRCGAQSAMVTGSRNALPQVVHL